MKLAYIYCIINASYDDIFAEFERKNNTNLVFLLLIYPQVFKIFYNWPV